MVILFVCLFVFVPMTVNKKYCIRMLFKGTVCVCNKLIPSLHTKVHNGIQYVKQMTFKHYARSCCHCPVNRTHKLLILPLSPAWPVMITCNQTTQNVPVFFVCLFFGFVIINSKFIMMRPLGQFCLCCYGGNSNRTIYIYIYLFVCSLLMQASLLHFNKSDRKAIFRTFELRDHGGSWCPCLERQFKVRKT